MPSTTIAGLSIFALVYLLILAGENSPRKLDRPAAGLIGGVLMVLAGVLTRRQAAAAIDLSTLALLLGMMIVVHYVRVSGLLDWMARRMLRLGATPHGLLWVVCAAAGLLSALFVNDTICLLMTPLVLSVARRSRLPAEPYLLALATSSNAGSLMTITGNPQDMLVGQSSHWTWGAYLLRMAPVGLVCLAINGCVVAWVYRKSLAAATLNADTTAVGDEQPLHRRLARRVVVAGAGLLAALLAGAPMDLATLSAAVALLVLANRPADEAFQAVDWSLLLFFSGLFVVVGGVTHVTSHWIGLLLPRVTRHDGTLPQLALFSGSSVVGANLFSNVPFVMLMRSYLPLRPRSSLLWLALAASSTLAGNLTLVGSVANLIVAEKARPEVDLSFWSFLRVGALTTAFTVAAAVLMLYAYGRLGWA